jgi:hypothetical protein
MMKKMGSFTGSDPEVLKYISEKVQDQSIYEGYLEKKSGSFLGSWQKRYFKLHLNALLYSKSEKEEPVGMLEKEDVLHVDTIHKDQYYVIRLKVKSKENKLYELRSKSKEERDAWLDALRNQWIKKQQPEEVIKLENTSGSSSTTATSTSSSTTTATSTSSTTTTLEASLFYVETLKESNLDILYEKEDYSMIVQMDQEEDTKENILYEDQHIHACTIYKLIHLLTESKGEGEFIKLFLLTYNSFISSSELLTLLHARFNTPPPRKDSTSFTEFYHSKLLKIRLRICQILNNWISDYYFNIENPVEFSKEVESFCHEMSLVGMKTSSTKILKSLSKLEKKEKKEESILEEIKQEEEEEEQEEWMMKYTAKEIAQQLTLITFDYFKKLTPR